VDFRQDQTKYPS
jgi:uncharacterized membrane protein